jgi:hypothetical protein
MSLYFSASAVASELDPECRIDAGAMPDAGAGGGADAPPVDPSAGTTDAGVDPRGAAADVADDDDGSADDDAEIDNSPLRNDPHVKRLRNQLRSAKRKVASSREFAETAKALGISAAELRELKSHSENYRQLLPTIQSREFLEFLSRQQGGQQQNNRAEPDRRQEPALPAFNEDEFPFDKNDPGGRWMLDRERQHHTEKNELVSMVRALANDVARLTQGATSEQRTRDVTQWKSAIDGACSKVPEKINGLPIRNMLRDALVGCRAEAKRLGRTVTPQQAVAHYLKEFGLSSTTQAAAKAAASQRIAEHNKTLPGRASFAGGQPSSARDPRQKETVRDVNRRLTGRSFP